MTHHLFSASCRHSPRCVFLHSLQGPKFSIPQPPPSPPRGHCHCSPRLWSAPSLHLPTLSLVPLGFLPGPKSTNLFLIWWLLSCPSATYPTTDFLDWQVCHFKDVFSSSFTKASLQLKTCGNVAFHKPLPSAHHVPGSPGEQDKGLILLTSLSFVASVVFL